MPHNISEYFEQYRIETKLGAGGMALVYRAFDTTLQRSVAIKFLHSHLANRNDVRERFTREARAAAQINHPNVVGVFAIGEHKTHQYMVLEYIDGQDLDHLIRNDGPLNPDTAADIIRQCCLGLDALHQHTIVHRDIKPHNIFLTKSGIAKLGDLGLARSLSEDQELTATGEILGTPAYMSPEQITNTTAIDIRSDIHALGGTLFTLLTGRRPFDGKTLYTLCDQVVTSERPILSDFCPHVDVDSTLTQIVSTALHKDPEQRYQNPQAMANALADYLTHQGSPISSPVPNPAPDPTSMSVTTNTEKRLSATAINNAKHTADGINTEIDHQVPPSKKEYTSKNKAPRENKTVEKNTSEYPLQKIYIAFAAVCACIFIILVIILSSSERQIYSNQDYKLVYGEDSTGPWLTLHIKNFNLRLRRIPAGSYNIGNGIGNAASKKFTTVTLSTDIWIADHECTQALIDAIYDNKRDNTNSRLQNTQQVVHSLNWEQAHKHLENLENHFKEVGRFRLPTESEWEIACRAQSTTAFCFGDSVTQLSDYGNCADASSGLEWADNSINDGHKECAPAQQFSANAWGFYDMHGNLWEWCEDGYSNSFGSRSRTDPLYTNKSHKVIRGGSWQEAPSYARSASRKSKKMSDSSTTIGFRIALILNDTYNQKIQNP